MWPDRQIVQTVKDLCVVDQENGFYMTSRHLKEYRKIAINRIHMTRQSVEEKSSKTVIQITRKH